MKYQHYYQLVSTYGQFDVEYKVYAARKDKQNNIEIASIPLVLVGNHPQEILETLKHISEDIKKYPAVDKGDCDIYHENLMYEDEENIDD